MSRAAPPSRLVVHVDELVLDGVATRDRHRVADAFEREMTRLCATPGAADRLARASSADASRPPAITVPPDAGPDELGRRVAAAVFDVLVPAGEVRRR